MMNSLCALLLLAAPALAHSGVSQIVVDGTKYPPWDPRIDSFLGDVKRIQWPYATLKIALPNVGPVSGPLSANFAPVNNISSPAIACGPDATPPALKAVARPGATVSVKWSNIILMHRGPILTWMGEFPSPNTAATQVKFFKVDAPSYDAATDTWANERAAKNGMTHSFQIPSDIKPGTYVVRTELLALHANSPSMVMTPISGPEFYLACFNVEVTGNGTATPKGVTFPGAYKLGDKGLSFSPYYGTGSGVEKNSKYITPGPPLYEGKHDAPTGSPPIVKETGAYTGQLQIKYEALKEKVDLYGGKIIDLVNKAWPANKELKDIGMDYIKMQFSPEWRETFTRYEGVKSEIDAFKVELQKQ